MKILGWFISVTSDFWIITSFYSLQFWSPKWNCILCTLIIIYFKVIYVLFIGLGFFKLLASAGLHYIWTIFSYFCLTISFCLFLSPLSGHVPCMCIRPFEDAYSSFLDGLLYYCSLLLCFILHHFYVYMFKFTNSVLHIWFAFNSIQCNQSSPEKW